MLFQFPSEYTINKIPWEMQVSLSNTVPYFRGHMEYGYMYYTAGTEGGSSGAPIMNFKGKILGIHHSNLLKGFPSSSITNLKKEERKIWNMGSVFVVIMNEANKIHRLDNNTTEDFFPNPPNLDLGEPKSRMGIFMRVRYKIFGGPIEKLFF